jgi:hypothetical protein
MDASMDASADATDDASPEDRSVHPAGDSQAPGARG